MRTLRVIINGGVKIEGGGGFKDFEKLINGDVKIKRGEGWEQNIKEKRQK